MMDCHCFTFFLSCLLLACVGDDILGEMGALTLHSSLQSENCFFVEILVFFKLWILPFNFIPLTSDFTQSSLPNQCSI